MKIITSSALSFSLPVTFFFHSLPFNFRYCEKDLTLPTLSTFSDPEAHPDFKLDVELKLGLERLSLGWSLSLDWSFANFLSREIYCIIL